MAFRNLHYDSRLKWHYRSMRAVRWIGGPVWAGSWYLMWLEITRWHHVTPSLAFNPGPVHEGDVRPRPGRPLKVLYAVCALAPLVVIADWVVRIRTQRGPQT